jgi:hypothetical protein
MDTPQHIFMLHVQGRILPNNAASGMMYILHDAVGM